MAKLPVVDKAERDEIRAQLKTYMERHGIGAPRLYERMSFTLERIDQPYVDRRSLQRFLRDDVRTDDEKVIRYRRFLSIAAPEIVVPPSKTDVSPFASAFHDFVKQRTVLPVAVSSDEDPDRSIPLAEVTGRKSLAEYEGRFAVSERAFGADPGEDTPADVHWVLLPDPSRTFLRIIVLVRMRAEGMDAPSSDEEIYKPVSADAFMLPFGMADLLVVNKPSMSAGGSFTLFRDVSATQGADLTVLEGASLTALAPWSPSEPVSTVRLVRIESAAASASS